MESSTVASKASCERRFRQINSSTSPCPSSRVNMIPLTLKSLMHIRRKKPQSALVMMNFVSLPFIALAFDGEVGKGAGLEKAQEPVR